MKYASQINIVIVVGALVTVGYALSQTVWKSPVTPSFEVGGHRPTGASSSERNEAPESSEAEMSGREDLRRQSQSPRPGALQPNREPEAGSGADRQPPTAGPRRALPAGLYSRERNSTAGGPRVITTRPGFPPEGGDPIPERTGSERQEESSPLSTEAGRGSSPSGAPNRVGQSPAGNTPARPQADRSARGTRRNTPPPPPPARSTNR